MKRAQKKQQKTKREHELFARIQSKNYAFLLSQTKRANVRSTADLVDKMITKYRVTTLTKGMEPIFF